MSWIGRCASHGWRIAGASYPPDAAIIVIPTWQHGLQATALDANTLFVALHALIAEDDQETPRVIIDHAQVQRLLGLTPPGSASSAEASGANDLLALPVPAGSFRPRRVTPPFGWIRLPPPQGN